jgi:protein involved in polysaccharide export with SLBB domain
MKKRRGGWDFLGRVILGICLFPTMVWPQQRNPAAPLPQAPRAIPAQTPQGVNPVLSAPSNYLIQPNDVLDIRVFREPDLNTTARVANDGTIMVPLIGQVQVGGRSIGQAAQDIQSRLGTSYLPNPQVTLNITQFHHRRFTILGQVNRSGTYDFPDEGSLDILQALGLAGGYTSIADPSRVIIKRVVNGKVTSFRVNAKKLAAGKSDEYVPVLPGDVITVSESLF